MVTPSHLRKSPHICPRCGRPMNPPQKKGNPWKCRTDGCPISLGYFSERSLLELKRAGLVPKDAVAPLYVEASA